MTVVKVVLQKDFTILYNAVLGDPNLSFKAKGLWAYCMSRPADWQFHVSHLATVCKEKEKAIYAALDELIEAKLVVRTQTNKAKGERKGREGFGSVEYTIYPFPQEIQEMFAHRRFAHAQVADTQKDVLQRKDKNKERKEINKDPPPPSSKQPDLDAAPTKEEEEEIQRRLKERPKNAPKIKSMKLWTAKVLTEIRSDAKSLNHDMDLMEERKSRIAKHRTEALKYDKQIVNGWKVWALDNRVEFSNNRRCTPIPYDCAEDIWDINVVWRKDNGK